MFDSLLSEMAHKPSASRHVLGENGRGKICSQLGGIKETLRKTGPGALLFNRSRMPNHSVGADLEEGSKDTGFAAH